MAEEIEGLRRLGFEGLLTERDGRLRRRELVGGGGEDMVGFAREGMDGDGETPEMQASEWSLRYSSSHE